MHQSSLIITAKESVCLMLHHWCKDFCNIFYAAMLIRILMLLSKSFVEKCPCCLWNTPVGRKDVKEG